MNSKALAYVGTAAYLLSLSCGIQAAPPELQTPSPVIYLADNLDEKDKLGWCIDTLGRGFAEQLQAHSCKPQGGDVQFLYNEQTGQILSVEFDGKCMDWSAPNTDIPFGLLDCAADASQRFIYDAEAMQIHPASDESLCVTAGASSKAAGPFMSRALIMSSCSDADSALNQWIVSSN